MSTLSHLLERQEKLCMTRRLTSALSPATQMACSTRSMPAIASRTEASVPNSPSAPHATSTRRGMCEMPAVSQVTTKGPSSQPSFNSCSTHSKMGFRMMFKPFSRAVARILRRCVHSVRQQCRLRRLTLVLHFFTPAATVHALYVPPKWCTGPRGLESSVQNQDSIDHAWRNTTEAMHSPFPSQALLLLL